MRLATQWLRTF